MREDITSIPVTDIFDEHDGCPVCRMRDLLETRVTDYITGAAMMEPDVRQETNAHPTCADRRQGNEQKECRGFPKGVLCAVPQAIERTARRCVAFLQNV